MKRTVTATLFSLAQGYLDRKEEITIVSQESQNDFVAEYRGNRYRVHRSAAGEYVLVLDSILGPKQKVLLIRPDRSALVKEISDLFDLRKLLHADFITVESPRLPASYYIVMKKGYSHAGSSANDAGSWIFCSDKHGSKVHGDVILVKYKPVKAGAKTEADIVGMSEANIQFLVKKLDLKLVNDPA